MIDFDFKSLFTDCLGKATGYFEILWIKEHPWIRSVPAPKVRWSVQFHPRKYSLLVGSQNSFGSKTNTYGKQSGFIGLFRIWEDFRIFVVQKYQSHQKKEVGPCLGNTA